MGACYPGEAFFSSGQAQSEPELHKLGTGTASSPAAFGNIVGVASRLECPWWLWPTVAVLKRRQKEWQQKGHKENPVLVLSMYFAPSNILGKNPGVLWVS